MEVTFEYGQNRVSVNIGNVSTVKSLRNSARYRNVRACFDVPENASLERQEGSRWEVVGQQDAVEDGDVFRWSLVSGDKGVI